MKKKNLITYELLNDRAVIANSFLSSFVANFHTYYWRLAFY